MCMYDTKPPFRELIKDLLLRSLSAGDLSRALDAVSESVTTFYPDVKIWFAETLGRRQSFLSGAGKESFLPPERTQLSDRYAVFMQNAQNVPPEEKEILLSIFKIITAIYEDG